MRPQKTSAPDGGIRTGHHVDDSISDVLGRQDFGLLVERVDHSAASLGPVARLRAVGAPMLLLALRSSGVNMGGFLEPHRAATSVFLPQVF